jgi:hypothetical protein
MKSLQKPKELCRNEIESIITSIGDEILFLEKTKSNLISYTYSESIKGKLVLLDFKRLVQEISRLSMEIEILHDLRTEYTSLQQKL